MPSHAPKACPGPAKGYAVSVQDLSFRFGNRPILTGLTFALPSGSFSGIVGPSGCGKTTLLRILGGLLPLERSAIGNILLDGEALNPDHTRHIAYLPQQDDLAPYLSTRETLMHHARIRRIPDGRTAVTEMLERFGFKSADATCRVSDLSGGMRKRVSLAIELFSAPKLLLLDEPTSGLDDVNVAKVDDSLCDIRSRGTTIVVVTHRLRDHAFDFLLTLDEDGGQAAFGPPHAGSLQAPHCHETRCRDTRPG
ncbi:ATP-binding cassette domain-containing protein [Verrucomicrobiota bacterium]